MYLQLGGKEEQKLLFLMWPKLSWKQALQVTYGSLI